MSEWISVKDRLPEHDQKVLIFAEGKIDYHIGDTVIAITHIGNHKLFHDSPDRWGWVSPWQYFSTNYEITYWMPLPAPPERRALPVWKIKKMLLEHVENKTIAQSFIDMIDSMNDEETYNESK